MPTFQDLTIDILQPSTTNVRHHLDVGGNEDDRAFVESIRSHGILQPICVRRHPAMRDRYEIIAGERRYLGARLAGLTQVPCLVYDDCGEVMLRQRQLTENYQRKQLTPVQRHQSIWEYLSFRQAQDPNVTIEIVAAEICVPAGTVRPVVATWSKLTPETRDALISDPVLGEQVQYRDLQALADRRDPRMQRSYLDAIVKAMSGTPATATQRRAKRRPAPIAISPDQYAVYSHRFALPAESGARSPATLAVKPLKTGTMPRLTLTLAASPDALSPAQRATTAAAVRAQVDALLTQLDAFAGEQDGATESAPKRE